MNAASRLVHQGAIARHLHLIFVSFMTRRQLAVLVLSAAVLLSALAMIYVTYENRVLHADYQHYVAQKAKLQVQRGQLLLERSTWMMQARLQHIAEIKLGMAIPDRRSVVIVHELWNK